MHPGVFRPWERRSDCSEGNVCLVLTAGGIVWVKHFVVPYKYKQRGQQELPVSISSLHHSSDSDSLSASPGTMRSRRRARMLNVTCGAAQVSRWGQRAPRGVQEFALLPPPGSEVILVTLNDFLYKITESISGAQGIKKGPPRLFLAQLSSGGLLSLSLPVSAHFTDWGTRGNNPTAAGERNQQRDHIWRV